MVAGPGQGSAYTPSPSNLTSWVGPAYTPLPSRHSVSILQYTEGNGQKAESFF